MGFYSRVKLDYPVSLGDYRFRARPTSRWCCTSFTCRPLAPGVDLRTRLRAARAQLFATPFDDLRAQGARRADPHARSRRLRLGPRLAGDHVNRWGHGYSYSGSTLFDKEGDDESIPAAASRRAGRVAFANSDAGWDPYAHAAIDQANRAVGELLGVPGTAKRA